MLRSRITTCLLLKDRGLYKTTKFGNPKYVGDPINAVKIFNDKKADELIFLDIDSTVQKKEPDYDLISIIASKCRMPICYGGGIKSISQIRRIIGLGVEKVSISSAFFDRPELLLQASEEFGNQSIVLTLDIKKYGFINKKYRVFSLNGKKMQRFDFENILPNLRAYGIGELFINCIDREGTLLGYDFELVEYLSQLVDVPISVNGGASSYSDLNKLIKRFHPIGAAAGSIFVFKGKYKAVLIQYPDLAEKSQICNLD
tara:strand:+ start:184 stop:957 length:774 start_codon:yes stop_codon:yes gene_type:complete